jgi:3-hydroxyisobutyrate dehydrogenase-like beta-hydroxyacid dehydrogenase
VALEAEMDHEAIGLLHPGAMGAAVGAELVRAGRQVMWASQGRSQASRERARAAGLTDVGTLEAVVERCRWVLSICPPHAAVALARRVAAAGVTFIDANAIAPSTAATIAASIEEAGGHYVDGGLIGQPPQEGRPVHLWLSGPRAREAASLFEGTGVLARIVPGDAFAASALKMCFAAWTKGSAALLLAVRAAAATLRVEDVLLGEWEELSPSLVATSRAAGAQAATKGWRWVAEMHEIAETFRASGLPDGFHEAAAELFEKAPRLGEARADEETLRAVLAAFGHASAAPSHRPD